MESNKVVDMQTEEETELNEPNRKKQKVSECPFKSNFKVNDSVEIANEWEGVDDDLSKQCSTDGELLDNDNDKSHNKKVGDNSNDLDENDVPDSETDEGPSHDDLRQFDVLDDIDHHSDQDESRCDSDSNYSMDSDVPDEEIEAMLDEGIF